MTDDLPTSEPQEAYYSLVRKDILPLVRDLRNCAVLDLGCGAGETSKYLKTIGVAAQVTGVEGHKASADLAATKLDRVYHLDLDREFIDTSGTPFDLVLCLDVLEHLVDPWLFLQKVSLVLSKNGILVASIPNVRNIRVILPLLLKGQWTYQDAGILDRTHLRFFTRSTACELIKSAGFRIQSVDQMGPPFPRPSWFLRPLSLGLLNPFLDVQFLIRAQNP